MAKRQRDDAAPPPSKRRGKQASRAAPRAADNADAAAADAAAFHALAVAVDGDAPWPRYVYVKRHEEAGEAEARAVFVTGLPPTWRPAGEVVGALFGGVGAVEAVVLHPDERSAIVSYASPTSASSLLRRAASGAAPLAVDLPPPDAPFGLKAWVEEHKAQFPGNEVLQKRLDAWVAAYEDEDARAKAAAAAAASEDGWTVVVRHGGRKKSAGGGVSVGAVAPAAAAAALQARKAKQEADFYRFQRREARRNDLADLRAKFEEDKRRVAALRESRRFRPA